MESPTAFMFTRTSYAVVPRWWCSLSRADLGARTEQLLNASYARRNWYNRQSGDTAAFVYVAFAFEWVAATDHAADPIARLDEVSVMPQCGAHPALLDAAVEIELAGCLRAARPGIASAAWRSAFSAFAVDEADQWKLIPHAEREHTFGSRLAG